MVQHLWPPRHQETAKWVGLSLQRICERLWTFDRALTGPLLPPFSKVCYTTPKASKNLKVHMLWRSPPRQTSWICAKVQAGQVTSPNTCQHMPYATVPRANSQCVPCANASQLHTSAHCTSEIFLVLDPGWNTCFQLNQSVLEGHNSKFQPHCSMNLQHLATTSSEIRFKLRA